MKDYSEKPLSKSVKEMKNFANFLIPYTFPIATIEDEQDITILKQRELVIDGYQININFSKAQYSEDKSIDSLQISSVNFPFLPFNLVCKIARSFLGEEHLGYTEFMRNGFKFYCWTMCYYLGNKAPLASHKIDCSFEGLNYKVLNDGTVNLYSC